MKKTTLFATLCVCFFNSYIFAGPLAPTTRVLVPCNAPCFQDCEWQVDIFYSYNNAAHQGVRHFSDSHTSTSDVITTTRARIDVPPYFRDGSGGGVAINYFFMRHVGVGVEGNWWNGSRKGFSGEATRTITTLGGEHIDRDHRRFARASRTATHQLSASLILRYPFDGDIMCWAPYIFGGGGGVWNGSGSGFGHIGAGAEFRVTESIAFFADWRWQFMSGHSRANVQQSSAVQHLIAEGLTELREADGRRRNDVGMTRAGVRLIF